MLSHDYPAFALLSVPQYASTAQCKKNLFFSHYHLLREEINL